MKLTLQLRLNTIVNASSAATLNVESFDGFSLLLDGDEQSGADALLLEGDMQAGTDVLLIEGIS